MVHEYIQIEHRGPVAIITLNRPERLNALSTALMEELAGELEILDDSQETRAVVLTGSEKAFAAGADVTEMADQGFIEAYRSGFISRQWDRIGRLQTPLIAAISGYALGGGLELAMACDILIAAENARFGQPEITLGVIPGAGGTQRLTRLVGRAKAMDMILTGRTLDVEEAERAGLVSRVAATDRVIEEAVRVAQRIADMSAPAVSLARECVGRADEVSLAEGMRFERRIFYALFATEDQSEGMAAFTEKRQPDFKDR